MLAWRGFGGLGFRWLFIIGRFLSCRSGLLISPLCTFILVYLEDYCMLLPVRLAFIATYNELAIFA